LVDRFLQPLLGEGLVFYGHFYEPSALSQVKSMVSITEARLTLNPQGSSQETKS
jgi:hypothetical protein